MFLSEAASECVDQSDRRLLYAVTEGQLRFGEKTYVQ